jgi:hypothetical protein
VFNEVVKSLAKPEAAQYKKLMSALFSRDRTADQHHQASIRHITYNDMHADPSHNEAGDALINIAQAKTILEQIFKRHGASPIQMPLLSPLFDEHPADGFSDRVTMMDTAGGLVQLPHDLRTPFAAYMARQRCEFKPVRRYGVVALSSEVFYWLET